MNYFDTKKKKKKKMDLLLIYWICPVDFANSAAKLNQLMNTRPEIPPIKAPCKNKMYIFLLKKNQCK